MPILLMSGVASAYSVYRCRYDSVARRACCCPAATQEVTAPETTHDTAVAAPCCCDVETVKVAQAPSDAARAQPVQVIAPLFAIVLRPIATVLSSGSRATLLAEQPRGVGPPIILLKHSFQI